MTIYVLNNQLEEPIEYDYGGNTISLEPGETRTSDFGLAQHALKKLSCRGVTLREES